ncbi:GNAT family N-acetyltransferase [Burkholderiaceae bacterium DAT-1]|nr:GNAT family N-acetyltransferase [Burkholderiaceae bacterium DAT-1]
MVAGLHFESLTALPEDIEALCGLSEAEGFRFLRRLIEDWQLGHNRFNLEGEVLMGGFVDDALVAIGGINCDCDDDQLGRLRRVFVHPDYRHTGVGRALVLLLEERARQSFKRLVLFTDRPDAAKFYESMGYQAVQGHPQRSHVKRF